MDGANFARTEIAQTTLSFNRINAAQHLRPIALLGCDDSVNATRAARHLVEDVDIQAILGFGSGKTLIDVAGSLLIQRGVLTVASLTANPQITQLPQPTGLPRMVWRTTMSSDQVAFATAHILESALESRGRSGRTRVTLIRPENTAANLSFAETFYRQLRFNGRAALENVQEYTEITYPLASEFSMAEIGALAKKAVDTNPTFLVTMGPGSTTNAFLEQVETGSAGHAPTYVVPFETMQTFRDFIGSSADRRHRLFTVNSVSNYVTNARFVIRYNNAHANHVDRNMNPGASYDAFYVLAYATLVVGEGPVTGRALGEAIGRLVPPGRAIEVGPMDIYAAINELSRGGNIDLQGASSALDFDLRTGEGPSDLALVCSGVGANGEATGEDIESGVVFRAKTRTVEGTIHCP
jgi:ABC-type branched-subunit amino acid transport system substrate-binding protein